MSRRSPGGSQADKSANGEVQGRFKPYPKYKDSGIEWLGDIPAHWDVKRMKYLSIIQPGKSIAKKKGDIEVSFIPMENLGESGRIDPSETRQISDVYEGYTYFEENDILVAKITPCFENLKGAVARGLKNNMGFGTTELHVIRPSPSVYANFLAYVTYGMHFRQLGKLEMKGTAGQQRVPEDFISNFRCALPPYSEQKGIVEFLNRETAKIDELIEITGRVVEILKEYRSALISAAVTGKIDVRGE
jgi:type I restriction enzyme S subunit